MSLESEQLAAEVQAHLEDAVWLAGVAAKDKSTARMHACVALQNLAGNPEKRASLAVPEVLKALGTVVSEDDGKCRVLAIHTLCMASGEKATRAQFAPSGCHGPLGTYLRNTVAPTELIAEHLAVVGCLLNMSSVDESKPLMAADGVDGFALLAGLCAVLNATREALGTGMLHEEGTKLATDLQTNAASVLWSLSKSKASRTRVGRVEGLLRALEDTVVTAPLASPATERALRALRNLLLSDDVKGDAVHAAVHGDHDLVASVVGLLGKPAGDDPAQALVVKKLVCEMLYELSGHKATKLELLVGDGEAPTPQAAAVLTAAVRFLTNTTPPPSKEVVECRQLLCGVLYEMAALPQFAPHLVVVGEVDPIGAVLAVLEASAKPAEGDELCDSPHARQFTSGVLYYCAHNPKALPAMHDRGHDIAQRAVLPSLKDRVESIRTFAFATLQKLVGSPALAKAAVEEWNAVPTACAVALASKKGNGRLAAVNVVQVLCMKDEHRDALVAQQVPLFVVQLLRVGKEGGREGDVVEGKERENALACVYALASSKQGGVREALAKVEGLVMALLDSAQNDEGKTQEFASGALLSLTSVKSQRDLLAEQLLPNFIPTYNKAQVVGKETLLGLVHNLSLDPAVRHRIAMDDKLMLFLVSIPPPLMSSFATHKLVVERACGLVDSVVDDDSQEVVEKLGKDGMLDRVLGLLGELVKHPNTEKAQRSASGALAALCYPTEAHATAMAALPSLLDLHAAVQGDEAKAHMSQCFQYLAATDANKPILTNNDKLLTAMIDGCRSNTNIADACAGTLCELAFPTHAEGDADRERLVDFGVLDALGDAVAHDRPKATMFACAGFLGLSLSPQSRAYMADTGIEQDLLGVLRRENNDPQAIHYAVLALSNIAQVDEVLSALNEENKATGGVVTALLPVIQHEGQARHVAAALCRSLDLTQEQEDTVQQAVLSEPKKLKEEGKEEGGEEEGVPESAEAVEAAAAKEANRQKQEKEAQKAQKAQHQVENLVNEENARHCTYLLREMEATERSYVDSLGNLKTFFEEPLLKLKNAKALGIATLFRDLERIRETHGDLHAKLKAILEEDRPKWPSLVSRALIAKAPELRLCSPFIENFDVMMKGFDKVLKDKGAIKVFEKAKKSCNLNLQAHLIMPIQRIPRLELMLRDLLKKTDERSPDYEEIATALKTIKDVALFCNQRKSEADMKFKLEAIATNLKHVPPGLNLATTKGREFVHEGRLRHIIKDGTRLAVANMWLLNDLLIWSDDNFTNASKDKVYSGHAALAKGKVKIEDSVAPELMSKLRIAARRGKGGVDLEHGFVVRPPKVAPEVLFARTPEEKQKWLGLFKTHFAK